jgi:hypothetical protein
MTVAPPKCQNDLEDSFPAHWLTLDHLTRPQANDAIATCSVGNRDFEAIADSGFSLDQSRRISARLKFLPQHVFWH